MPEPRVMLKFVPKNQNALNQSKTFIENRLTTGNVVVRTRDADWTGTLEGVVLSLRIPNRASAEDFVNWVQTNISTLANRGTGLISFHLCSHDDLEVFDCRNDPRAEYREILF